MSYYLWKTFPLELELRNYFIFWLDLKALFVFDLLLANNFYLVFVLLSFGPPIWSAVIICFLLIWLTTIPKGKFFGWGYFYKTFKTELFLTWSLIFKTSCFLLKLEILCNCVFDLKFWKLFYLLLRQKDCASSIFFMEIMFGSLCILLANYFFSDDKFYFFF
jgi:hypothetical protein